MKRYTNRNWLIWLAIFAVFCYLVFVLKSVIMPFVAGIVIGYLLDPITTKTQKLGMSRSWATLLVVSVCIIILLPITILFLWYSIDQLGNFLSVLPNYVSNFVQKIEPMLIELQEEFPALSSQKIKETIGSNAADNVKIVGTVFKKVVSSGFALVNILSLIIITPIVAFYMLRDWHKFIEKVDSLLPREYKKSIRQIAKEIDKTIAGFIRGQLSVCLILGTFYSTGLYMLGVEFGLIIGMVAGIISFIPYVGSITGFVISVGVAFVQFDSYTPVFYVVALFLVGQFIEGNFLTPNLVGDSVGLHPVWIMFALLAGGVLLGFLGLMLAVPVAAIIGVLIRHSINNYKKSSLYLGS